MATPPKLELLYFDIHGLGARCRLAALIGKVPLTDTRLSREAFAALKAEGKLPYGQLPLLRVDGGATAAIAQSTAILRYLCTLGGLHPTDPLEAAKVDAALYGEKDALSSFFTIKYAERNGFGAVDAATDAAIFTALNEAVIPRHLASLEALLARSGTGWIAGTARPSAADLAWGTELHALANGAMLNLKPSLLDPCPRVRAFLDQFRALPEVKAYYAL